MADPVAEHIAALKDEDWAVREEAAVALGTFKDPRAVPPLLSALRDSDRAVRDAAIGALLSIGGPCVTALGDCLSDPLLGVQEAASSILAAIGDVRVLGPLISALGSADWIVRMHAAKALGRIRDGRAVPALMPLLHDKVKAVREEAATALAMIGPAAVPTLVQALKHEEWLVRLHAVEALGKMKTPAAVQPLLVVLFNDRDSAVREDSVRALGEIGSPEAVEFLVTVLKDPTLRPLAVEALGRIGDRRAVPVLIDIVTGVNRLSDSRVIAGCSEKWDEEMVTRGHAVQALGAIGDPAAIPALVAALQETVTRAEAAGALAKFGAAVIPVLLPLLAKEQDENIRYYLKEALTRVGWRPNRI